MACISVAAIAAAAPCASQAASKAVAPPACPVLTLAQPFSQFKDLNFYSLVPGGSFEAGETPWSMGQGASIGSGSESYAVNGTLGKSSLELPAGASAQSPVMCIEPNDRTLRWFARSIGGPAVIDADIVYESSEGPLVVHVRRAELTGSWVPSEVIHTGSVPLSAIGGGSARISVRFTALKGTAEIDDVFLDPRMR